MSDLSGQIQYLIDRQERIEAGDELCTHHWNGSDGCFEVYCSGCDKHLREERNELYIPFKDEAYCFSCLQTPEEKEKERLDHEESVRKSELETLALLVEKYPIENEHYKSRIAELEKERDELNKQLGEFQEGFFSYMAHCDHLQIEVDNLKKKIVNLTTPDESKKEQE